LYERNVLIRGTKRKNPGPEIMTPNPRSVLCPKCGRRSALEALVGLAVVEEVATMLTPAAWHAARTGKALCPAA
jgi:hypothetical protein